MCWCVFRYETRDAGVTNLRVMCHDAVEVSEHMIPDSSLHTLQLFFPDPWHKARHHKRRIVKAEFVEMLRGKLQLSDTGIFRYGNRLGKLRRTYD